VWLRPYARRLTAGIVIAQIHCSSETAMRPELKPAPERPALPVPLAALLRA
jgi:hypothetical protein